MSENLVEVKNLKMFFPVTGGVFGKVVNHVKAVNDVSFSIQKGETLGLVGESGCGKSTTAKCILRLLTPTGGEIHYQGKDLLTLSDKDMRKMRRHMQMIFQEPYASLDPRMKVEHIIGEPIAVHGLAKKGSPEYRERVYELMRMVELEPYMAVRYAHEFSGGQRQRIGIARALATGSELVLCDEPVSALDVSIQAQILNLLVRLKEEKGLTYLFIAHDLSVVRNISDRVAVMYLGRIVELAGSDELYANPCHPYTVSLLSAVPIPDPVLDRQRERIILSGDVPSPMNVPSGCAFHNRCPRACARCREEVPELRAVDGSGHLAACHLL